MAWKKSNNISNLPSFNNGVTSLGDVYRLQKTRENSEEFYELEIAEVIEIMLDQDDLPEMEDGTVDYSLIGAAKLRMVYSEHGKNESELSWTYPMDTNLKEYPLKGEYVIVQSYLGQQFYGQKVNLLASVNSNSIPGISNNAGDDSEFEIGDIFTINTDIRQL